MRPTATTPADMPRTFGNQTGLPRLPVPALDETLARYLRSLEPFLRQREELGELPAGATAASELQKRRDWAEKLVASGLGPKLNQRLLDVDQTTPNNWLDDRYWLLKAYHEWRAPLLINSDWWLELAADADTPADVVNDPGAAPAFSEAAITTQTWDQAQWGLRRATWLLYRAALYKLAIDNESLAPDASRAGAFCMHQYTRMFGVTRIPGLPHDWNTMASVENVRHVTVLINDHVYELQLLNEANEVLPLADVEKALKAMVADSQKSAAVPVGVLTSEQRDTWAHAREHLLSVAPQNRAAVDSIQSSLLVLSLDSCVLGLPENHPPASPGCEPTWADVAAINVSGAGRRAHNRWFDKAISLVVEPNGRAGILGEHSPADALIPSILGEYLLEEPAPAPDASFPQHLSNVSAAATAPAWKRLEWAADDATRASIATAEKNAAEVIRDSDIGILWFNGYGTDWIKKVARQAPDAYVQMALQVAYARVHGRQTGTYETASTRLYKHGRTDVIRSFSAEAYDFVKGLRSGLPPADLYKLLTTATGAHTKQTRDHSFGKGIDRHLLAMRLVFRPEDDGPVPELFSDELFAESQTWKLSTSGLSAGDRFLGTGFGSGYPEGFGVNYLAGSKVLKFGMESKRSNPKGDGNPIIMYKNAIVDALRTLRDIVEKGAPPPDAEKAKL
ncbi:carnitine O-acetyltransferase [Malassezia sp. CBS 17886]|nr:carnitine O-acetyltransferase [Malassezia sp. CBS 17886]